LVQIGSVVGHDAQPKVHRRHAAASKKRGRVHADSRRLAALIPPGATVEKLAEGFTWAEGRCG
jgi:hypothetical protein